MPLKGPYFITLRGGAGGRSCRIGRGGATIVFCSKSTLCHKVDVAAGGRVGAMAPPVFVLPPSNPLLDSNQNIHFRRM